MLQERLHKHILVTIEQQRNAGTRRETAASNKRLQFPFYAQTGSHYAWCSLSVTSRWRLQRAQKTAAEENVLRDFTKPSSFMSCFYRAVCACRQWCIHVGRKQWAECNEHSTDSDNTGQETYATVHTYMSKKLWEQHAVCRKKTGWMTDCRFADKETEMAGKVGVKVDCRRCRRSLHRCSSVILWGRHNQWLTW